MCRPDKECIVECTKKPKNTTTWLIGPHNSQTMCKNVQRKWKCKANVFFHYKKKVISIGDICLDEWTHIDHVYIISHIIWQNIFLALYLFLGECLCSQGSYDASLMSSQMWYIKEAFLKCYMSSAMFLHRSNAQWVFPLVPFELQT